MAGRFEQVAEQVRPHLSALEGLPGVDKLMAMVNNPGSSEMLIATAEGWDEITRLLTTALAEFDKHADLVPSKFDSEGARRFRQYETTVRTKTFPAAIGASRQLSTGLRKIEESLGEFWKIVGASFGVVVGGGTAVIAGVASAVMAAELVPHPVTQLAFVAGILGMLAGLIGIFVWLDQQTQAESEAFAAVLTADRFLDGGLVGQSGPQQSWPGTGGVAVVVGDSVDGWKVKPGVVRVEAIDLLRQAGSDVNHSGAEMTQAGRRASQLTLNPHHAGASGQRAVDAYDKAVARVARLLTDGGPATEKAGAELSRFADEIENLDAMMAARLGPK